MTVRATWAMTAALLIACLVPAPSPRVAAQEAPVALDALRASTRAIATMRGFVNVKGKKIGIGDFPLTDGRLTQLGSYFADQMDVALAWHAGPGGFEVVTRRDLCQVIRENKLWVDDRFDPSLHKKLGRLGQADLLLTGQITAMIETAWVSIRLLDTETGRVAWADSIVVSLEGGFGALATRPVFSDGCGVMPPPGPSVIAGAPVATSAPPVPGTPAVKTTPAVATPTATPDVTGVAVTSRPPKDRLQVRVWTDKSMYRIGDTVEFRVRANRDAYVMLVNIGTSGEVTILFPNRLHTSHFTRAGQEIVIPPPEARFVLTVEGPTGFDQVRAIATEEPLRLQATDFTRQAATFRSLNRVETRSLAAAITAERTRVAAERWAEDVVAVEVQSRRGE